MLALTLAFCCSLLVTIALGQHEHCNTQDELPDPNECCTRPIWVNRYMLKPCRFTLSETESYTKDLDSCNVICGVYKINVTLVNNRVDRVRLYRPRQIHAGGDAHWVRTVTESLRLCKSKITAMVGHHVPERDEMKQCEKASEVLEDCLNAQMYLHCPRESLIRNDGCDLVKDHLMRGCSYQSIPGVSLDRNGDDDDDEDDFEPLNNQSSN